jgi:hypothetical protein
MGFDLLAITAYEAGRVFGFILGVLICGGIPISYGFNKGQPIIGLVGGVVSAALVYPFGCVGGLPMALVFVVIITVMESMPSSTRRKRRKRRREPEYDFGDDFDRDRDQRRRSRDF